MNYGPPNEIPAIETVHETLNLQPALTVDLHYIVLAVTSIETVFMNNPSSDNQPFVVEEQSQGH